MRSPRSHFLAGFSHIPPETMCLSVPKGGDSVTHDKQAVDGWLGAPELRVRFPWAQLPRSVLGGHLEAASAFASHLMQLRLVLGVFGFSTTQRQAEIFLGILFTVFMARVKPP